MAWTFRKRKKLLSGVHLNYGSSGLSLNVGVPGASVTIGANGIYTNTGIPGTGIRNRKKISSQTTTNSVEDVQLSDADIKRAQRTIGCIYFFGLFGSYFLVLPILWLLMVEFYTPDNYWWLLAAISVLFFAINTIRLSKDIKSNNIYNSRYIFSITCTILAILVLGILFYVYLQDNYWQIYGFCALYIVTLMFNLVYCFKYSRKKQPSPKYYYEMTRAEYMEQLSKEQDTKQNEPTTKTEPCVSVSHTLVDTSKEKAQTHTSISTHSDQFQPSIDYTKEVLLYFSQPKVRNELERTYPPELIDICAYIVEQEKCVLSDIQATLGLSYQKVLASVKILEQARIVRQEGTQRKVMVTDETIAIRLLLRYAKEHF